MVKAASEIAPTAVWPSSCLITAVCHAALPYGHVCFVTLLVHHHALTCRGLEHAEIPDVSDMLI